MAVDEFDVVPFAVAECRRQQVGVQELGQLLIAWEQARYLARAGYGPNESYLQDLAAVIEHRNKRGYRRVPVTFANGGTSSNPANIQSSMWSWADAIDSLRKTPDGLLPEDVSALVRHLLWVHPWEDGNGRVAWIVFNWLKGNLIRGTAEPLPDFNW